MFYVYVMNLLVKFKYIVTGELRVGVGLEQEFELSKVLMDDKAGT